MLQRSFPRRIRTLFISDVHLGAPGSQPEMLLDFLRQIEAETIYMVGDIIDGWRLGRVWSWPQSHNDLVQELLRRAHNGTRLVYVPGNHDEFLRPYLGTAFGSIEIADRMVHESASGRRYLVTHGDEFDVVIRWAPWLSMLGAGIYTLVLKTNGIVNWFRRSFGLGYWSLADWTKQRVKGAVNVIGSFEEALIREAREAGADGIICGHIHHADSHDRFGIHYVNTGDWMESCTAVVEHHSGRLEIVRWTGTGALPAGASLAPEIAA